MPGTRKLGRPTDHRKAMLRAMVTYLLESGKIETTVTRAKEVRPITEKMITLAKNPTLANKRQLLSFITKEAVVYKLINEIAPKYAERNGGYTRIVRTGMRRGDAAEMAIIELIQGSDLHPKGYCPKLPALGQYLFSFMFCGEYADQRRTAGRKNGKHKRHPPLSGRMPFCSV